MEENFPLPRNLFRGRLDFGFISAWVSFWKVKLWVFMAVTRFGSDVIGLLGWLGSSLDDNKLQ
jgi:hypothetical protein